MTPETDTPKSMIQTRVPLGDGTEHESIRGKGFEGGFSDDLKRDSRRLWRALDLGRMGASLFYHDDDYAVVG